MLAVIILLVWMGWVSSFRVDVAYRVPRMVLRATPALSHQQELDRAIHHIRLFPHYRVQVCRHCEHLPFSNVV